MQRRVEAASFLVLFLLGLSFLVSDVAALGGAVYTSASTTTTAAAISTKTVTLVASAHLEYSCIFVVVEAGKVATVTVKSIADSLSNSYSAITGASSDTTSDVQIWGANETSSSTAAITITVTLSATMSATGSLLIQAYFVTGMTINGCTTANAAYSNNGTGVASATAQLATAQTPATGDFCLIGWGEQVTDTVAPTWTALVLPYIAGPTLGTASTTVSWDRLQTAYVLNYLPVIGSTKFPLAATGGTVTVFDWDMAVACMPATVLATVTSTTTATSTVTTTTTSVSTTTATTTVLAAGIQANATLVQQISPGKTLLLSSTVTGGTGSGYSYQWYSGSSATCTSDLTTLGTASTQAVSPVMSTFYCYKVADSGANSQYSSTVDVTVAALETTTSTTTVTTPTTTTVTDTSTSTSTVTSNQTLTSTTTVTTPTTTTETSTSTYSTTTTVINNSTYTVVNDVTYQVGVGGPGGTTTTTLYQNSTTTAQGQPITTVGLAGIALIVVAVVGALMVTNTKVTVNGKRRL